MKLTTEWKNKRLLSITYTDETVKYLQALAHHLGLLKAAVKSESATLDIHLYDVPGLEVDDFPNGRYLTIFPDSIYLMDDDWETEADLSIILKGTCEGCGQQLTDVAHIDGFGDYLCPSCMQEAHFYHDEEDRWILKESLGGLISGASEAALVKVYDILKEEE